MSSEKQKEYGKYLRSKEWKEKRDQFRNTWGNKCACCGSTEKLHIHHLNYECLGNETFKDVILLCKGCHLSTHNGRLKIWIFTELEYEAFQKIKHIITKGIGNYITFIID
jgi:5-methylcytosine-specific restriction endonuclease McrA